MMTQNVDSGGDAPTDPIHVLARLLGLFVREYGASLVSSTIKRLERFELTATIDGHRGRWSFEMVQGDDPELPEAWQASLELPGVSAPVAAGITSNDPEAVMRAVFNKAAGRGRG